MAIDCTKGQHTCNYRAITDAKIPKIEQIFTLKLTLDHLNQMALVKMQISWETGIPLIPSDKTNFHVTPDCPPSI